MKATHLKPLCGTMIAALALAGTAVAATPSGTTEKSAPYGMTQPGKLSAQDHEFLKKASEINLTEIELGKAAQRLSSDPNIKKIADGIVKDHTKANQQLQRLAASKGVQLPTAPSMGERRSLGSLEKMQGDKFNSEFLSFNMKGHEQAIALFEKESARTQDPDIKAWAQKTLPDLKHHLAMAQSGKPSAVAEKIKPQQQQYQKQQERQQQYQKQQQKGSW